MPIVVKVGGAAGNALDPALREIAARPDVVLVHGGSDEVDRLGTAMGRPPEYLTSPSGVVSRRSDAAHLEVLVAAMAGTVQTRLVARLGALGRRAVGLSGADGGLVRAARKEAVRAVVDGKVRILRDDRSGTIETVDRSLLDLLLGAGILPVVGPPAVTADGEVVNVDADRLAAAVAVALRAESLVLLTNVAGLLRDPGDPASRIAVVQRTEFESVLPLARGRMRKKVLAVREALDGGVPQVVIGPSAGATPIAAARAGGGTVFR
jgi:[amino group carrier protein]-L-2-aminoadipate 6-kinase